MHIKVLSYNIHKGFAFRRKRFVLSRIKEAVKALDVDLVFLQEVIGKHLRFETNVPDWPLGSQLEYLADQVWPHYAYGRNAVYSEGHHGNAVLSRYPIEAFDNYDISVDQAERRGVLHCRIHEASLNLRFSCFCTHLEPVGRFRLRQSERLLSTLSDCLAGQENEFSSHLIIAGDFNDWKGLACRALEKSFGLKETGREYCGRLQRTFPSLFPFLSLDRIYTKGFKIRSVKVLRGEPWRRLSDHLPIFAELEI